MEFRLRALKPVCVITVILIAVSVGVFLGQDAEHVEAGELPTHDTALFEPAPEPEVPICPAADCESGPLVICATDHPCDTPPTFCFARPEGRPIGPRGSLFDRAPCDNLL